MKTVLQTAAVLAWLGLSAGHAAAQSTFKAEQPAPAQASASDRTPSRAFAASVKFEVSHTAQGPFVQFVPRLGYDFSNWSVDVALPIEFVSASSTTTGATSHRGIGDGSLSLSYSLESDRINFVSTGLVAAPTGDYTVGLGAGQVTWNWTNHVDRLFNWVAPFVDVGVGNSLSAGNATATLAAAGGGTRSRALPYTTVGKLVQIGAGVDLYVWGPLSWNLSGYDTIPWGEQNIISLFVAQTKTGQPVGAKKLRAFEAAAQTQVTASEAADHGFSSSIDISATRYLFLSIAFSRSVQLNLNVYSATLGVNLVRMYRAARQRP